MKRAVLLVLSGVSLALASWGIPGAHRASLLSEAASKPTPPGRSPLELMVSDSDPLKSVTTTSTKPPTNALEKTVVAQAASALPRKRAWDVAFFSKIAAARNGQPISFELPQGVVASGNIRHSVGTAAGTVYVSGQMTQPYVGAFFFQRKARPGVAREFAGVIEFPASQKAYRIELSGRDQGYELVERPLGSVRCVGFPRAALTKSAAPPEKESSLKLGNFTNLPIPPYQQGILVLESLHGATPVLYLDFAGGYTDTYGGITYARPDVSNDQIREVWSRVAEDFLPFNINVTTDLEVYQNAPQGSRQRVLITPTDTVAPEAGGAAYIGSFNWPIEIPCWVYELSGKDCAEACSHELGHALGLDHDGQIINGVTNIYFSGQGSGETGWAPIMGLSYYDNVSQWSKGEYSYANNQHDQLAMIVSLNNGVAYRPDDTGDRLATSRYLELYPDYSAGAEGVIERTEDTDAFQFTTGGGPVFLRAGPATAGPNLAIQAMLCDATDTILTTSNPQNALWASLTTNLPAGTYTFKVTGAGRNDPLLNGFSSYASLGYYSITGTVANARLPTRFAVPEHSPNGTIVGRVAPMITNTEALAFAIVSGDPNHTFAIDSCGTLSVLDNTLLDYPLLASQTQLAVQFELFVNITNLQNNSLSEINRRVVVAVLPIPPDITAEPQDLAARAGTTVSFAVSASSTLPLQFQWFFNGAPVPGANTSTLVLTNVQLSDAGQYFVSAMSWFAANTSRVAVLTVNPSAPVVALQPHTLAVFPGFDAEFDCAVSGSEPLAYQWQVDGVDIPGATQPRLVLTNVSLRNVGSYHLVASNSIGTAISADAPLVIVPVAAWGWNSSGQTDLPIELTNVVQIAAGPLHNVALRRDGSVIAWGASNLCNVPPGLSNTVAVAAGANHSLALKSDGTVIGWGDDSAGQLDVPPEATSLVAIAAGATRSLGLTSAGQVLGWGRSSFSSAALPLGLTNIVAIAAGSNHFLALKAGGTVVAWGDDSRGQIDVPLNLTDVAAISAGSSHSLALNRYGTVVAWGDNANGQSALPAGLSNVIGISAGAFNSFALRADGTLLGWGAGQAADTKSFPNCGQSAVPACVTNITEVRSGTAHTLALAGDGPPFVTSPAVDRFSRAELAVVFRAEATGALPLSYQWQFFSTNLPRATNQLLVLNNVSFANAGPYSVLVSNALGMVSASQGSLTVDPAPYIISQPNAQQVWVGNRVALDVLAGGQAPLFYQWFFNGAPLSGATDAVLTFEQISYVQSGLYSVIVSNASGSITSQKVRLSVAQVAGWGLGTNRLDFENNYGQALVPDGLTGVVQVAAGGYHSLALKDDGTVVAWGAGSGQTSQREGFYDYGQSSVPPGLNQVVAVAAGGYHSLALTEQGQVVAWGAGTLQSNVFWFGLPPYGQSSVPDGLNGVTAISAGDFHSAAVTQDGRVVVWGGPTVAFGPTNVPSSVSNVISIASRGNNIVALRSDGSLVQWGAGPPVIVKSNAVAITASATSFLALLGDGKPIWGGVDIAPRVRLNALQAIAAGYYHALAIKYDGTLVTWGKTNVYQLAGIPNGLAHVIDIAAGQYHSLAVLGNRSISIRTQPTDRMAFAGGQTAFSVGAVGILPLHYQWFFNGKRLPGATNAWLSLTNLQLADAGNYQALVGGSLISRAAKLSILLPVGPALNAPDLAWSCGGNALWFGQTNVTHDGVQAARSGRIGDSQFSSLQTTVTGPGSLSFWWKVSSEEWFDKLSFSIDGFLETDISGEVDWQNQTFNIPTGKHLLAWAYQKDPSFADGEDCGWLDEVVFSPDLLIIIRQPASQTVRADEPLLLSVSANGPSPLRYQWLKDAAPLSNSISHELLIRNPTRQDSGTYAVRVSAPTASVMSSNAVVLVIAPQRLTSPEWMSDGAFKIISRDSQGVALKPSELGSFQAQVSTNLVDWFPLSSPLSLSDGDPVLIDQNGTNYQNRFYRIIEHVPAYP